MNINELTLEEKIIIYKHRLKQLTLKQSYGPVDVSAIVDTNKSGNLMITIHNNFDDRGEIISLDDNKCDELYQLLKSRHMLRKGILNYEYLSKNKTKDDNLNGV